jgi:hypothetical protein
LREERVKRERRGKSLTQRRRGAKGRKGRAEGGGRERGCRLVPPVPSNEFAARIGKSLTRLKKGMPIRECSAEKPQVVRNRTFTAEVKVLGL